MSFDSFPAPWAPGGGCSAYNHPQIPFTFMACNCTEITGANLIIIRTREV